MAPDDDQIELIRHTHADLHQLEGLRLVAAQEARPGDCDPPPPEVAQAGDVAPPGAHDDAAAKAAHRLPALARHQGGQRARQAVVAAQLEVVAGIGHDQIDAMGGDGLVELGLLEHRELDGGAAELLRQVVGKRLVALDHDRLGAEGEHAERQTIRRVCGRAEQHEDDEHHPKQRTHGTPPLRGRKPGSIRPTRSSATLMRPARNISALSSRAARRMPRSPPVSR